MNAAQPTGLMLELTRVLPAPPSVVFGVVSDASELAKWWGPKGFTTPSLDFDPRVGESYRIEMQPPEGDRFHLTGEFREVDPPVRLAYTFVWEPPDPDDVETLVVLAFRDLGARRRWPSLRARSRPRTGSPSTATGGATRSTSSSGSSRRRPRALGPSRPRRAP